MLDLSFIRLEPNFSDAKNTGASTTTESFDFTQICLSPFESYVQTTNTALGIAFDGNYAVHLVDCDDVLVRDITGNVFISERTIDGLPQIDFEIINIGVDFFAKRLFFKFIHTVSNYVWYSNPVLVTDYFARQTTRFIYKKKASDAVFKKIRLRTYFLVNDEESISTEYTTYTGTRQTSRMINTVFEKYLFNRIDTFTFRRLNEMLRSDVLYANGYKVTSKQTLGSKDPEPGANFFSIDFKLPIDYSSTADDSYQVNTPFELSSKTPSGVYALADSVTDIIGVFNKPILAGSGELKLFKDGTVLGTFQVTDAVVSGNTFTIGLGLTLLPGVYHIIMDEGFMLTYLGEPSPAITSAETWSFSIVEGYFSSTHYDSSYYLT